MMNFTKPQQEALICDYVLALITTQEDSILDTLSNSDTSSRPYTSLTDEEITWLWSKANSFIAKHKFKYEPFHNKYYMIKKVYKLTDDEAMTWSSKRNP